jgi:hypothetical protein
MFMAVTMLKELVQRKLLGDTGYSATGVCYYISEYVQDKIWGRPAVGTFAKAVELAKGAIPATIVKAAKVKNLAQKGGQAHGIAQKLDYPTLNTPFKINSLYRVCLWVGPESEAPADADDINHAAILVTGAGAEVVFLEPNFGFYQGTPDATSVTNKDIFEEGVKALYLADTIKAVNFRYKRVRGL